MLGINTFNFLQLATEDVRSVFSLTTWLNYQHSRPWTHLVTEFHQGMPEEQKSCNIFLPFQSTLASILTIQVLDYLVIYIDCKLPIHMMLPWLLTLDTDMKHKTTAWMQCYV